MPSAASAPRIPRLEELRAAAERGDEGAFEDLCREILWSEQPEGAFLEAIDLAMSRFGSFHLPRDLALRGAQVHPGSARLQRLGQLFAPPQVQRAPASGSDLSASFRWLREDSRDYAGRWVAVREGRLIADAATLKDLHQLAAGQLDDRTLITRVPGSGKGDAPRP